MSIPKAAIRRLIRRYQLAIVSAGGRRAALVEGADAVPAETQRVLCAVVRDLQVLTFTNEDGHREHLRVRGPRSAFWASGWRRLARQCAAVGAWSIVERERIQYRADVARIRASRLSGPNASAQTLNEVK